MLSFFGIFVLWAFATIVTAANTDTARPCALAWLEEGNDESLELFYTNTLNV